jgi:hypothetical protein
MKASLIAAALSLCAALPAQARCKHEQMPTVLDAIVVTPSGAYTVAEYEARMEHRQHLEATKVTLAPIVVTPNDPYADAPTQVATHTAAIAHTSASAVPSPHMQQPSLIKFLRRLLF